MFAVCAIGVTQDGGEEPEPGRYPGRCGHAGADKGREKMYEAKPSSAVARIALGGVDDADLHELGMGQETDDFLPIWPTAGAEAKWQKNGRDRKYSNRVKADSNRKQRTKTGKPDLDTISG